MCCFKCYFEPNERFDINPLSLNDAHFGPFHQTLDAEMKRFHKKELGTKPKQAEPITPDEEALLWLKGELGCQSARALQNTVYFYNCKIFGLRSYDEHRDLKCCRVYLEYTDFGSKTNAGGLKHLKVDNKCVCQYENVADADHCVVNILNSI